MHGGDNHQRHRRIGRLRSAYLITALLLPTLVAGCATSRDTAQPAFVPPDPAMTGLTTTPTAVATSVRPTASPSGTPSATPRADLRFVFPVQTSNVDYHPTHSEYPGTDIFADCGSPVVAVTDGVILEVSLVDRYSKSGPQGPYNGGLSVSLLGDDGARYYGSHLSVVKSEIRAGVRVRAGQRVGSVGKTGNANNVCHLHFGISPKCRGTGDWWIRRGVVWPAPFLDSWRRKVNKSAAAKVTAWQKENGCPKAPSS
jgi:murein DD-endopeptidase MepM/ murein hydrolase activator NlpD